MPFRPSMPEPTVGPTLDDSLRRRGVTEAVSGYRSLGCYYDFSQRVLNGTSTEPQTNYPQFCCDWCVNRNTEYTICGVEYATQCYCDSTLSNAKSASASWCSDTCAGQGSQECGGTWYMNLYSATDPIIMAATYTSLASQQVPEFSNLGCFSDRSGTRILQQNWTTASMNDPRYCCEWCANLNNNYQWCGVEFGTQCFCDSTTHGATQASDAACSLACPGAPAYQCGAAYRMNLYQLTGVVPTATSASTLPAETSATAQPTGQGGLSGGAIGGVVVGALAAVGLLGMLLFFLMRGRRRSRAPSESSTSTASQLSKTLFGNPALEMATKDNTHELQSFGGVPYTEPQPVTDHERRVYEMDANR